MGCRLEIRLVRLNYHLACTLLAALMEATAMLGVAQWRGLMARNKGQPPANGQWRTTTEELNPANSHVGELGSGAALETP